MHLRTLTRQGNAWTLCIPQDHIAVLDWHDGDTLELTVLRGSRALIVTSQRQASLSFDHEAMTSTTTGAAETL